MSSSNVMSSHRSLASLQQARLHFESGRLDQATASCQHAVAAAPGACAAHALLARLYRLRGLPQPARFHAHEACRLAGGAGWRDVVAVSVDLLAMDEARLAREVLALVDPHDPTLGADHAVVAQQFIALGDEPAARYFTERARATCGRARPQRLPAHT